MDNQEAIEVIKLALSQVEWDYPMDYATAFDIAISALQAQDAPGINVGDMVSRQKAIDAMCLACGHDCDKSKFVYNAPQDEQVIMCPEHYALSTLPSAQSELEDKIRAIGYTGKEGRIYIGGRLFAIRELPQ